MCELYAVHREDLEFLYTGRLACGRHSNFVYDYSLQISPVVILSLNHSGEMCVMLLFTVFIHGCKVP